MFKLQINTNYPPINAQVPSFANRNKNFVPSPVMQQHTVTSNLMHFVSLPLSPPIAMPRPMELNVLNSTILEERWHNVETYPFANIQNLRATERLYASKK